jgi:cytochrome c
MKKIFLPFLVLSLFTACGGGGDKKTDADKKEDVTDNTQNPDYQKGLDLVARNNCMTCHKIDETFTGPPYMEVARKYASYPDTIVAHLAGKVINGGSGVWGEIFMTPNPSVTQQDAESMVKYILLLKK